MSIKHFIWGFQPHFRGGQECHAKAVFQLLDKRFAPEVFLVGVRDEELADRCPACVEPEGDFWIPSDSFDGVVESAKPLVATYPESQAFYSGLRAGEIVAEGLRRRAIHETICKVIADSPDKPAGMVYHASFPVKRDGYLVSVVLGLQVPVIESHAVLRIARSQIHEYRSFKAAVSLVDATTDQFLMDAASELERPDAGEGIGSLRTAGELIRIAGGRLMTDCAYKSDSNLDLTGCWQTLFDVCNAVAGLKYERAVGSGRIVVARQEHAALKPLIAFVSPPSVHNSRGARKLLELASRGASLHVNAKSVFGLVEVGEYAPEQEDLFEVNVLDHHVWELAHNGRALMHVHSGQPRLPASPFDAEKLRVDLARIFLGLSPEHANRIVSLVEQAAKERHGTMLVVVQDAAEEANRLGSQGAALQPLVATPELIKHVTPIDGAVLLGPDAVCHAIGVILDGMATPQGDPARGARFNSALRYVQTHDQPCMAVVVSEDGGVDLIPDLLPTIRRSEVERVIIRLRAVESESPIKRRSFNFLVDWLERHSFYLLREHCDEVNSLIRQIDACLALEDPAAFRIVRRQFVVNLNFDPELYYTAE